MYLILKRHMSVWDLSLVLQRLTDKLFESMATCPHLLAWKTAFLVAITSARRARELRALRHDHPYLTMYFTALDNYSFSPQSHY